MKETENVSALEFISRIAACVAVNGALTLKGEYADKEFPHWAVLPHGRNCSPMTHITMHKRWYQMKYRCTYGTANGAKVSAKLSRREAALVEWILDEADAAITLAMKNPWATIDF